MKLTTIALATAFVLSGTAAFANTVHHRAAVRADRNAVGMGQLHPNYGNPNGNPDGPTTLSGTDKGYAIPGWTDEQTRYWIDSATGPKD